MADDAWLRLALAVLATWRITHLLANEDGPAGAIFRLRARLGHGRLGSAMDCFHCMSLWTAAPLAFFVTSRPLPWIVSWLAASGGACLLERMGGQRVVIAGGSQEPPGGPDVLR